MYNILNDISQAKSAPFGASFISMITTTNYIAASAKTLLQMSAQSGRWTMNLNTYSMFIGSPCCGKTPTIKAAVTEPIKTLSNEIRNKVA